MTPAFRRVPHYDAVNNFRDFGDWKTSDGGRVVAGKLFRSAHLHRASLADLARIAAAGITTITDLRRPEERQVRPGAWLGKLQLRMINAGDDVEGSASAGNEPPHLAAFRESASDVAAMRSALGDHYETIPYETVHVAAFSEYFDALAQDSGAMLVHCAAGKDRTGILVWLTHRLLDVHPEDAMEDYLLSNEAGNIAERLAYLRKSTGQIYGKEVDDEALVALLSVEPEYIRRCEAALIAKSGSVQAYLTEVLGIDRAKAARIKDRLIE